MASPEPPEEGQSGLKRKLFESWLSTVGSKPPPKPRSSLPAAAMPAASRVTPVVPAALPVLHDDGQQRDSESTQIFQHVPPELLRRAQAGHSDAPPALHDRTIPTDERTAVFRVPPELLALSIQSMNEQGVPVDPALLAAAEQRVAGRPDAAAAQLFLDDEHTKVGAMAWPRSDSEAPRPLVEQRAADDVEATHGSSDASIEVGDTSTSDVSDLATEVEAGVLPEARSMWPRRAAWLLLAALAAGALLSVGDDQPLNGWAKRISALVTR